MEPWRAVDTHNEGVGALNRVLEGSVDQWSQICITLIRVRIQVKRCLRIRITMMWIRNTALSIRIYYFVMYSAYCGEQNLHC